LETFKEFYELVVPVAVVIVIVVVVVDPFQMDYPTCINSLNASLPPIRAFGSVAKRFMDLSFSSYLCPPSPSSSLILWETKRINRVESK